MMNPKRIFLALPIEPVEPVIAKMKVLKKLLANYRIKWVEVDYLHLTLFFFGEITPSQIADIEIILNSALKNSSPFTFSLSGPGIFKRGKKPGVLWLGINAPETLFELKKAIDKSVATLGFISDDQVFRPHLTLGRFAPQQEITDVLGSAFKESQLSEPAVFSASRLILFESKLYPSGAQYFPIKVFPLTP